VGTVALRLTSVLTYHGSRRVPAGLDLDVELAMLGSIVIPCRPRSHLPAHSANGQSAASASEGPPAG
jgi:hypothetical protein